MEELATFATGIRSLDQLLGSGIQEGTIVLVRGGPGAGKTTLTMQMLEHYLEPKDAGERANRRAALFSLESPPGEVLRRARTNFFKALPERANDRLLLVNRSEMVDVLEETSPGALHEELKRRLNDTVKKLSAGRSSRTPPLVIIDSLNVLVGLAPGADKREQVHAICCWFRDLVERKPEHKAPRPIIILTAEHHPEDSAHGSLAAESFMCDTEILLTTEQLPRRGQVLSSREARSFCRVTKSRSGRNQARRCCYEIVPGKGLFFYDTFPGDGRLLLFHENDPQRQGVEEFFKLDVPQLFPSLQCESFDRANLHHVLDNQRRYHQVPGRTDMYLASFDTYWINWYVESNQRMHISADLATQGALGSDLPAATRRALVGLVHRFALEPKAPSDEALTAALTEARIEGAPDVGVLQLLVESARQHVQSEAGQSGIFELLPWERIRLYGSRRSKVLKELGGGPHQLRGRDEGKVRSVPYNFNLGYLVCRRDLLVDISESELKEAIEDVCTYRERWVHGDTDGETRKKAIRDACESVERIRQGRTGSPGNRSFTWEEAIALAKVTKHEIHIETQVFDTYLATALELVWAHGGELRILPDYTILDWETKTRTALRQAMALLNYMYEHEITRPQSARSATPRGEQERTWVFARHWHSTLIDMLTTREPTTRETSTRFVWSEVGAELEIAPVPTTAIGTPAGQAPAHYCCLGEWHLALLKGSENTELGYDIINWLVGSQSVGEQAARGAMLPTADYFYRIYGNARCINIPERDPKSVPSVTFNEILALAKDSRSRNLIFDYRRTMREFHGVLEAIRGRYFAEPVQLWEALEDMHDRIGALGSNEPPPG
jgi:archaellum biogenesis ATPase FlaH